MHAYSVCDDDRAKCSHSKDPGLSMHDENISFAASYFCKTVYALRRISDLGLAFSGPSRRAAAYRARV